jgi:HlyD family secretion protein
MTVRSRALGLSVLFMLLVAACNKAEKTYQGWIEANLIFVAPDEIGRVETLSVREGDVVKKGDPLFTLDDELQQAELAQVKASLTNAQQTYDRASVLLKSGAGTQKDYDAAEALLRDARARLNSSQTRLSRRSLFSSVGGTVQQIYYRPGEMVPADRAVLSLLPPGNIKVRFYLPEAVLPSIAYGDTVRVACDGCPAGLTARVSFIARESEYTPPVIYSLDERAKLVFLVEALPDRPNDMRVGQPVDVALSGQKAPTPQPEASR